MLAPPASHPEPRVDAAPTPSHPTSFAGGRYRVVRFLGEGGKKRVYLAHDIRLDRDVAFALIKHDGLDVEGLTRIRREAQAMAQLGDHPHVVTVYDIGDEPSHRQGSGQASQPYLVSQYMAGGSLEELLSSAEDHRLPLDQALQIADQVCQALEHAHSQGVVHRDVKPGNVWLAAAGGQGLGDRGQGGAEAPDTRGLTPAPRSLTPTTTPVVVKLGDFGLALSLDRSRLTQAGMMVGTVAYMAPEQALGGEVTARSDQEVWRAVAELAERTRHPSPLGSTAFVESTRLTCIPRQLGAATALMGDRERARAHYEQALDVCQRLRFRPEIALTRLAMAELLLEEAVSDQPLAISDQAGRLTADKLTADPSKAHGLKVDALQHLDFAIEEFQAMKMQPSLERAGNPRGS